MCHPEKYDEFPEVKKDLIATFLYSPATCDSFEEDQMKVVSYDSVLVKDGMLHHVELEFAFDLCPQQHRLRTPDYVFRKITNGRLSISKVFP